MLAKEIRKRGLLSIALLLQILFLARPTEAEKFGLKLSGGINYLTVGDVNRGVKGEIDFRKEWLITVDPGTSVEAKARPVHLGFDFEGDVIINLTSRIGIGLGVGYIQAARTSELNFRYPDGTEGGCIIEPKISAVPIKLGLFYTLPINEVINIAFNSGIGWYMAKYSYDFRPEGALVDTTITQTVRSGDFGFHGGIGVEFNFFSNISFVLEGQGRYVKIGGFEGKIRHSGIVMPYEEEGNLYYYEQTVSWGEYPQVLVHESKPSWPGVNNVRKAKIDFSGITFLAGIKINF
jgi:opacity protein-like surface antigen